MILDSNFYEFSLLMLNVCDNLLYFIKDTSPVDTGRYMNIQITLWFIDYLTNSTNSWNECFIINRGYKIGTKKNRYAECICNSENY